MERDGKQDAMIEEWRCVYLRDRSRYFAFQRKSQPIIKQSKRKKNSTLTRDLNSLKIYSYTNFKLPSFESTIFFTIKRASLFVRRSQTNGLFVEVYFSCQLTSKVM